MLLQNYRVGKIDRFGLDYKTVAQGNPSIIYASVSGFGTKGARIGQAATDSVMQAYTGIMSINRDATGNAAADQHARDRFCHRALHLPGGLGCALQARDERHGRTYRDQPARGVFGVSRKRH